MAVQKLKRVPTEAVKSAQTRGAMTARARHAFATKTTTAARSLGIMRASACVQNVVLVRELEKVDPEKTTDARQARRQDVGDANAKTASALRIPSAAQIHGMMPVSSSVQVIAVDASEEDLQRVGEPQAMDALRLETLDAGAVNAKIASAPLTPIVAKRLGMKPA